MLYINWFKQLNKTDFWIVSIFWPYRYKEVWVKEWDSKKCTVRETVISKDWNFYIKAWNKEERKFIETPYEGKIDRDFFKEYKKKYDIVVKTKDEVEVDVWDKNVKENVKTSWDEFTVNKISDFLIKEMLLQTDTVEEEPMNWERPEYNWEENYLERLKGMFVKDTITWAKLNTRHKFRKGKEFDLWIEKEETEDEALPF